MSCELYVGNYPSSFTSEDLLTLFQDYEGIELLRFLKKVKKCYAFLRCVDQDQVVEVVTAMHDIDVCGRNLIVRSSDDNLQAAIQQLQQNDAADKYTEGLSYSHDSKACTPESAGRSYGGFNKSQRNVLYDQHGSRSVNYSNGSPSYNQSERKSTDPNQSLYDSSQNTFQGYQTQSDLYHYPMSNSHEATSCASHSMNNSEYSYRGNRSRYSFAHESSLAYKSNNDGYSIGYYDDKLENADLNQDLSTDLYTTANALETSDQLSAAENPGIAKDQLFFVSVVNFPLGTPIKDLYALFSDYNPFKILVICNVPRADKTPTEAIVSFKSKKDATDAIINLDNTVYRRRVLLVTDAADLSLVPELLSFGWKDTKNNPSQSHDRLYTGHKNNQRY